jgi:hypothetical protein
MSEWERWENESTHVNLRPEYRQDDVYFNQRRPSNEYHENQQRFATTKSKLVDDDPWRKVKVDEYTPTGINHNRQYQRNNHENPYGDYDLQQLNVRQGFQNDIRQNYQTLNNNGYRNTNAEYRRGYQHSNQIGRYQQGYPSNQSINQGYQTHPNYSKERYGQSNHMNGYRDDIRQRYQPIHNDNINQQRFNHQNESRSNTGVHNKRANRFEVWEADRVRGRPSDLRLNDRYADGAMRRNGVTASYSQPHHNLLASNRYYNSQDYNYVNNRQTKRFPSYEDPNFDPTSNIEPIPGSYSKRQSQQAYNHVDTDYYEKNQFKTPYGLNQNSNIYDNNFNVRNDKVSSRMLNNYVYQRDGIGLSSNVRPDYRANLRGYQNVPYQQNQRVRGMNDNYEYNQHTTKRFPSYEQDDDPTCPKESR